MLARSPSAYPQPYHQTPPSLHSPSISTPTATSQSHDVQPSPPNPSHTYPHIAVTPLTRPQRLNSQYPNPPLSQNNQISPSTEYQPPSTHFLPSAGAGPGFQNHQGPMLPPFSSIQTMSGSQSNMSSLRLDNGNRHFRPPSIPPHTQSTSKKRVPSSNVTSADSSGAEEDDGLPASGLVAPWEVLRGLADVAIERAAKAC